MTYEEYKNIDNSLKNARSREYRRRKAAWAPGVWNTDEGRKARETADSAIHDLNVSIRDNRRGFREAVAANEEGKAVVGLARRFAVG